MPMLSKHGNPERSLAPGEGRGRGWERGWGRGRGRGLEVFAL